MLKPQMIQRPGRPPLSEWDEKIPQAPQAFHYYPLGGQWSILSSAQLYALDCAKPGRPPKFTLVQARYVKDEYWSGRKTIAALARLFSVTQKTIARLVHGETMWYA